MVVKRTFLFLLVFELFLQIVAAQGPSITAKLSPRLQMLLSGDANRVAIARRVLPIKSGRGYAEPVIPGFIQFQGDANALRAALAPLGAQIHSINGDVAIADIPVRTLQTIASHPNVLRISEAKPVKTDSDRSVPETGANSSFGWGVTGRPSVSPWSGNTGKNAIIGIVDTGIDLTHRDFRDSSGKTRILGLWDQTAMRPPCQGSQCGLQSPALQSGVGSNSGIECTPRQIDAVNKKPNLASVFDSSGAAPVPIAVADFDRDGYQDVAGQNSDGSVRVSLGTGTVFSGTPLNSPQTAGPAISFLQVGDFNRDGNPDLVAIHPVANAISIFLGKGNGTFYRKPPKSSGPGVETYSVGNRPTSVAVGDVDGDGFVDLAVTNYFDSTVSIFFGDGTGFFSTSFFYTFPVWDSISPNYPQGNFPSGVAMADFDGDGRLDLAIANWGRSGPVLGISEALSILIGNGDGTFKPAKTISTGHFGLAVAVGDFNQDGNPDVALQSYSHFVTVLLGRGDGTFTDPVDYDAGGTTGFFTGLNSLVAYDVNGDGKLDLATLVILGTTSGHFYNAIAKLHGNGNGTFQDGIASNTSASGNPLSEDTSGLAAGNFTEIVCTEVDLDGHGTHVAGIAAGNGSATNVPAKNPAYWYIGMAPEAGLIIVKSSSSDDDILKAIDYIEQKAATINPSLPVVINLSLGGELGPHDGTARLDEQVDLRSGPGRIIVAAAGNSADKNLHVSGTIDNGGSDDIDFDVPDGLSAIAFDLWYSGVNNIGVQIRGPCGITDPPLYWTLTGSSNSFPLLGCASDAEITASPGASDGRYNGDHGSHIEIFDPQQGHWAIRLRASGCGTPVCVANDKRGFDVWASESCNMDRDCLVFTGGNNGDPGHRIDPKKTLNSPATATTAIAVASYVTKTFWRSTNGPALDLSTPEGQISPSSSRGPRRSCPSLYCDPVEIEGAGGKPEIAAPGKEIVSSYAAGTPTDGCFVSAHCLDPDSQHVVLQGTSMAAPHVTGAVALLLSQFGKMSVGAVEGALSNARVDAFTYVYDPVTDTTVPPPNSTWGYGKLAVDLAMQGQGHTAIVPDVVNMSRSNAEAAITAAGLALGTITRGPSSSPVGTVISQSPAAGAILAHGSRVNLVLSGIPVPDVTGMDLTQAQSSLTAVLLKPGTVTYQSSATIPVKQVISEDPVAGTLLTINSPVNLVASGTIVPSVVGLTLAAAQAAITSGHLAVGLITTTNTSTMPVGSVGDQSPAAGDIVGQGTPVALLVSGNLVPNVVGLTQAAAQSALSAASLNLGIVSLAFSFTVPPGNVISQSPVAGSILGSGAPVNVIVSQGPSGTCATNVTASVKIMSTGFSFSVATMKYAKMVTIMNPGSSTITGPFLLVFDSLSSSAAVYSPTSTTQCVAPLGSPYVTIPIGSLGPGSSAAITVFFTNSSPSTPITYTNRVMAGGGTP